MSRQIILDTETTGINPDDGHRIIEIGCIEVIDRRTTGNHYHQYINPQRGVDEGAFKVHGLSNDFLSDKPLFEDIVEPFLEFIKGAELLIHNAPFDVGFINAELLRLNRPKVHTLCTITDTLDLARHKHPGQRNSLDALCKRYQVDATDRIYHGALLDAQLLADVYLNMTAGQNKMDFNEANPVNNKQSISNLQSTSPVIYADLNETKLHHEFLAIIKKKADKCVWDTFKG
ncbi:MAG: DNA polymerase III subunit epsilon [Gammaproteobacteria bacterium]|nr:DNA polymerase III subunit epsilon [Gammaproteobacteria bacterium]